MHNLPWEFGFEKVTWRRWDRPAGVFLEGYGGDYLPNVWTSLMLSLERCKLCSPQVRLWPLEYIIYVGTMLHMCESIYWIYYSLWSITSKTRSRLDFRKGERDTEHFMLTTSPAFFPLPLVSPLLQFADPKNRDVSMQHEIKRRCIELTIQGANLL